MKVNSNLDKFQHFEKLIKINTLNINTSKLINLIIILDSESRIETFPNVNETRRVLSFKGRMILRTFHSLVKSFV